MSPTLASVMMDALPYLAQYPYGCVEQTLSRFVPAAIASKTAKDLGLPSSRVPAELDAMVDAGLKRLYGFQHSDGGWGWWQSDRTNRWMSAYVVYGLSLGRAAGLQVDASVLERGRGYLTSHLGAALDNPEEHAWMVFALASTGGAPKAGLDKAFERRSKLSKRGRALLALALIASNDKRARIAVENLDDILQAAKDRQDASVGDANDIWQTSEAIEATAYTLMAVYRHDPASPWVKPLTDFLVMRRNGGKWRTTRDTAFSLYALSELASREKAGAAAGSFIVLVNGREAARVRFSAGGMDLTGPVVLTDAAFRPGENTVTLRRDGAQVTGYYAATFDVYNRDENMKGVGGDVKVVRTYTLLGTPLGGLRNDHVTDRVRHAGGVRRPRARGRRGEGEQGRRVPHDRGPEARGLRGGGAEERPGAVRVPVRPRGAAPGPGGLLPHAAARGGDEALLRAARRGARPLPRPARPRRSHVRSRAARHLRRDASGGAGRSRAWEARGSEGIGADVGRPRRRLMR